MISKRLDKVASFVRSKVIIDVGSDHGLLPNYLFENNKIDFAVVTDISEKCVLKAKKNLTKYYDKTSFLCGDGLSMIEKEDLPDKLLSQNDKIVPVDVIIAGMGGNEIKNILSLKNKIQFTHFILQPQKNVKMLREFLMLNKFQIKQDVVVKDGKMFYNILDVVRSDKIYKLNTYELNFGYNGKNRTEDFNKYVAFKINKCKSILKTKEVLEIREELELLQKINEEGNNV